MGSPKKLRSLVHLILVAIGVLALSAAPPTSAHNTQAASSHFQEANCDRLNSEGMDLYHQARYDEALQKFQEALFCYRGIGDRTGESVTLSNIGGVYYCLREYEKALYCNQQVLTIVRGIGDRVAEATTLGNIGLIYYHLGQYEEALDHYQQELAIRREIGDRTEEATTLNDIGIVYRSLGQYQKTLDYHQQALAIHREIGHRNGEAKALNEIGVVCLFLGRYEEALDCLQQALSIKREIGDRKGEAATLNGIGGIYQAMGQYEGALDYYQQALIIWRETGYRIGEAAALNNIGNIYTKLGQHEEALSYYQQALRIQREIGDRPGEGTTLSNVGDIYKNLGRYEEALVYQKQALSIFQEIDAYSSEAMALGRIGRISYGLEQWERALDYYQQALAIWQEAGHRVEEAAALVNIGSAYECLGQYEEALDYYEQAIAVIETMRGEMTTEEFKSGFAAEQAGAYDHIISLLIKMDRPTDAYAYAQRAKARTLLDQLSNARISPTAGSDPALIEQEERLRGEIHALEKQLQGEWAKPKDLRSDDAIRSLTERLEIRRAEYASLLPTLKLSNPEYASLTTVDPLTLADTQKLLTDATLVDYYVTADQTIAFVVTQGAFHAVPVCITQASLAESLRGLHLFSYLEGVPPALQTLYQDLFAPVAPYIHTDLVVIAPHGVLHYVPFAALHDGERYLVERYTLFYTPSASVLLFALEKRKTTVAPPLVLGDPDGTLPNARQEAQATADLYGVTAYVGEEAQERLLWEEGAGAGILHLSTHGVYDARSPLFSHVVLAPDDQEDGRLDVYEIYNRGLNLENADLVVLSACQTGLGELTPEDKVVVSRGDEIVGLNRALIYAGAPSVMASLWSVDDVSTRELMERFYTHLREGMSKAGALRAAQMEMIAEGTYAHPYYWAAFGVTGDPGEGVHVLPEMVATATPEDGEGCVSICPAVVLPLALVVLVGVKRRRR